MLNYADDSVCCPDCCEEGVLDGEPCPMCEGSGRIFCDEDGNTRPAPAHFEARGATDVAAVIAREEALGRSVERSPLDEVLASNSSFKSLDELVEDIERTGYTPTLRCDCDPRLLYVVAELEQRGVDPQHLYVVFATKGGVSTCFGFPANALERALAAGKRSNRAIDRINARCLAEALGARL